MKYWKTYKTTKVHLKISNKGDIKVISWNGIEDDSVINIFNGRKRLGSHNYYYVYRLVDYVFRGPLPKGYCVHHKDFDKTNDSLSNLQRLTIKEHAKIHQDHNKEIEYHYVYTPQRICSLRTQKKLAKYLTENDIDLEELKYIYEKYIDVF